MIFLDAVVSRIEIAAGLASVILPIVIGGGILLAAIAFTVIFVQKKKAAKRTGAGSKASESAEPLPENKPEGKEK